MGTRHRAGLGMSENSDAIVVIVSEETGIISMAKNGVLIRRLDRQNLFNLLQEEIVPPSAYAPNLPISMEKIILKCTQKNPDRRYETMGDLLLDLKNFDL